MSASGTLYTYPNNYRAYKALIAAQYSGSKVTVDPSFEFGKTNQTDEFLKKFPTGQVPAFETTSGDCIFDSNAIAYAVANEALKGKSSLQQSQVLMWIQFSESELLQPITQLVFPVMGLTPMNKSAQTKATAAIKSRLAVLNDHLKSKTFMVGERISLADIVLTCTLLRLYEYIMDSDFGKPYPHVHRWFNTIINQEKVKSVIGEFKRCDKMGVFDLNKFKEMQAKLGLGKDDSKKEKPAKAPKEAAPKKEVKKEAPKEEAAPPAPKPKDPLDALPAGSFNMDDFKRFYSNNDEDKSVPYFWEKFDKENYSIWFGEYLFKEDLTKIFMTCNLVGGMFQRLEKLRKNAFASVCVFGKDNDNTISGVWVWRGHDLAFTLSEDWQIDYESYSWKKMDPDTDETKKMVDNYFKWVGEDSEGRAFNQGKIFK